MSKSTESISRGFNIATKNPQLFFPIVIPIVVQLLFVILANVVFPARYIFGYPPFTYEMVVPNLTLSLVGSFLAYFIGFVVSCIIVDMANDALNGRRIDFNKSMKIVTGRLGVVLVAAFIAAICAFTIVLLPVALFIDVILVIEWADAVDSTKRAFNFVVKNLGEVIVFLIIVIIVSIIVGLGFGYIPAVGPYIGAIAGWILNVIFLTASVQFYLSLRPTGQAPPPPPPPPPPT